MDFVGLGGVRLSKIIELRGGSMAGSKSARRNRSMALSGALVLALLLPCLVLAQSYRGSIRGKSAIWDETQFTVHTSGTWISPC